MNNAASKTVDAYIAAQPEQVRDTLTRVRSAIRKAIPLSEELITYRMPTYKLRGAAVLYFASWKHHYSLYPATSRLIAAFAEELAPYEIRKSTVRFPFSQPVPTKLIERLAKFRAQEVAARDQAEAPIEP